MKFPWIPSEIGCFEGDAATSPKLHHCTRCEHPFFMDATLADIAKAEKMVIEAVVCYECLMALTWAPDVSYPEEIKDYH